MVFDAARSEIVLFGGNLLPGGLMSDTWAYNGTTWTQRNSANVPPARQQHAMSYDSVRQRVVLFGGQSAGMPFGDTWEWDGVAWTQRVTARSPLSRYSHGMAFDGTRTILFGGFRGSYLQDTWALDASGWVPLTPASSPSSRRGHQMASNGAGEVLLFGGSTSGFGNETWAFNGTAWTQQSPATLPPTRSGPYLVHDPVGGRYLLFGGGSLMFQPQEDTWAYAGGQWTQMASQRAPSTRTDGAAAWFAPQQRFLVFGGSMQVPGDLRSREHGWEFGTSLASFMPFGPSVCPSLDPPALRGASQPRLGSTFQVRIESASAGAGFVLMGLSTTNWAGGTLPQDLSTFGTAPNCLLRVSADSTRYTGFGVSTTWSLTVPASLVFVGTTFHLQGFTFGAGTASLNTLAASNAGTAIVDID